MAQVKELLPWVSEVNATAVYLKKRRQFEIEIVPPPMSGIGASMQTSFWYKEKNYR